jgi:serine/threonine protein kinase
MEKFDGDLKSLIKKFSKHDIDVKNLLKSFIMLKFEVLGKALEYINNSCGICLDDIKLENILYKKYSDNNTYDLVFSDFGTSLFGNNLTTKCIPEGDSKDIELDIMRFKKAVEDFGNTF